MVKKRQAPLVSVETEEDKALKERLAKKITILPSGCWEWETKMTYGPPIIRLAGRRQIVRRVLYRLYVGNPLAGVTLRTTCGNHNCLNPHHVEIAAKPNRAAL